MPTYCFSCECGRSIEKVLPIAKCRTKSVRCTCGKSAVRDFAVEHGGTAHYAGAYPMLSESMGVHPKQIPTMVRKAQAAGVPTGFTKDGRAVLTSPGHRKRFAEAFGFYDRNAGFSDPKRR